MQIRTIQKGFKAFECKFEQFKRDSKHSNANSNYYKNDSKDLKVIQSILIQILTIRRESKHSNAYSNRSKRIRSIRK